MITLSLLLIIAGMFILYQCSSKYIHKAPSNRKQLLIRFRSILRLIAYGCFVVSGSLLCLYYGNSIGFVGWWIFATPVTFLLVLWVNDVTREPNKKLND